MNKEYLSNLEIDFDDQYDKYIENCKLYGINEKYFPFYSEISKLAKPLVMADVTTFRLEKEKIWSQIPFAGTLVIPIYCVNKSNFLFYNGFSIEEIPDLVKLAKEEKKVSFILPQSPTQYAGLDFLDPIFKECLVHTPFAEPIEALVEEKELNKWTAEFNTLAKFHVMDAMHNTQYHYQESSNFMNGMYAEALGQYFRVKLLGLDPLIEEISNSMIDDPMRAGRLLTKGDLLCATMLDPLGRHYNMSLSKLKRHDLLTNDKISFPVEIGRYLLKKTTKFVPSYEACVSLIDEYRDNQLYHLLTSLDTAVKNKKKQVILNSVSGLNEILDNVWAEAEQLEKQKNRIQDGITISLGMLGEFATNALGGTGGFLAGLGFKVLERSLDNSQKSISEKFTKWLNKDFMVNIYDFKRKMNTYQP